MSEKLEADDKSSIMVSCGETAWFLSVVFVLNAVPGGKQGNIKVVEINRLALPQSHH